MRISDWSSDVCSSDLAEAGARRGAAARDSRAPEARLRRADRRLAEARPAADALPPAVEAGGGDRKSDVSGKSVSGRVDPGGSRIIKKKNTHVETTLYINIYRKT